MQKMEAIALSQKGDHLPSKHCTLVKKKRSPPSTNRTLVKQRSPRKQIILL
ncbi:hypothetical protein JYQ62_31880 [Nostoc sp. UHCC 0702]|nr:hypothetical protein JYQ62_31880 [Nostoc sp. UHCC 0702]